MPAAKPDLLGIWGLFLFLVSPVHSPAGTGLYWGAALGLCLVSRLLHPAGGWEGAGKGREVLFTGKALPQYMDLSRERRGAGERRPLGHRAPPGLWVPVWGWGSLGAPHPGPG